MADEWHGERVPDARLPAGAFADPRVGVIGGTPDTATVAYWIGNYAANPGSAGSAAGSTVRVTHVFEKRWFEAPGGPSAASKSCHLEDRDLRDRTDKARDVAAHCRWVVVQSHMSLPISDDELTRLVFGTALVSPKPLQLDCSDGSQPLLLPMAPGAGLRPGASQPGRPAAGTR
jgi:hypothetical protein